jgi:hypothetical protein
MKACKAKGDRQEQKIAENPDMRKTLLPLIVCMAVILLPGGCGEANPILGDWILDKKASKAALDAFGGQKLGYPLEELGFTDTEPELKARISEEAFYLFQDNLLIAEESVTFKKEQDGGYTVCGADGFCGKARALGRRKMEIEIEKMGVFVFDAAGPR